MASIARTVFCSSKQYLWSVCGKQNPLRGRLLGGGRSECMPGWRGCEPSCRFMAFTTEPYQQFSTNPLIKQKEDDLDLMSPKVDDPLSHPDYFNVKELVTIRDLMDARVHLGHKIGLRNPYMKQFVFGNRLGVDIIDLELTLPLLHSALNFVAQVAYRKGIILFISRHMQTVPIVEKAADNCGEYSHCRHWKGGTFTNSTIQYGAVTRLPDACIYLYTHNNIFEQHVSITEVAKMNIPAVGIVDTSSDPRLISYPVPGNDDSPQAVELYCNLFKEAILRGKAKQRDHADLTGDTT